ncbi:MAG: bifunctional phosphoribosylaminoimidazolecarboxamide formyltransferase/IMP cyclohydrolase [Gemmatimonadetes bacterium]|nr:bifunctional phosphoribosylaminoimidazolecarboxamide formyltransferase/IMP cyclohydrolase [Gemmatimonadota bacterium]
MNRSTALLSVSAKAGLVEFARSLVARDWEIVSTGGTARALKQAGVPVTEVSELTGHPEMMEGRVKTLHPAIHAGLLARRDRVGDMDALLARGYRAIDLVAVNLYPFVETVTRGGVQLDEAMEQVDIGGPTLLRAAAKNHRFVWALVDPADYPQVIRALDGEADRLALRRRLAAKVFRHVSGYDAAIAAHLRAEGEGTTGTEELPAVVVEAQERIQGLRYGENPDQEAGFYAPAGLPRHGIPALTQLHGKELSYNNILDTDGALLALAPFAFCRRPAVVIIKHTTPCGLALGASVEEAFRRALRTDSVSAYGSVIATTRAVDGVAAAAIAELFVECLVAPAFADEALARLAQKKSLRLLAFPRDESARPQVHFEDERTATWWREQDADEERTQVAAFLALHGRAPRGWSARGVYGGTLVQTPPLPPFYGVPEAAGWTVVTKRAPDQREWDDLRFAWATVFSVKSNAIVLARDGATVGIGAGQMSRVDSSRLAVMKARDAGLEVGGTVLASDAFFPFRDGVEAAADAGVTAIVQPGGSVRDREVIAAADEHGIAMVFTGRRLFRH